MMLNLLAKTGKFRLWSAMTGPGEYKIEEIPSVHRINLLMSYPLVYEMEDAMPPTKPFEKGKDDEWQLAKWPGFCFCIPALLRRYRGDNLKFIVMDRSVEGRLQSMFKTRSNGERWVDLEYEKFHKFGNLGWPFTKPLQPTRWDDGLLGMEQWERDVIRAQDALVDDGLKKVGYSNVLRVDFCEFMHDFKAVMKRVARFCNIPYDDRWEDWRSKSYQNSVHSPEYWIDGEVH